MEKRKPEYRLLHIGMHSQGEEADRMADRLAEIFDLPSDNNKIRDFVGSIFEIKKVPTPGTKGHIGIETDDVDFAIECLKEKGIGMIEETVIRNESGKAVFGYLDLEVDGFGFHLMSPDF